MKKLIALLFFISLSFSASNWQDLSIIAILASIFVLAIMYAVGHGLEMNDLKFLAKEELVQVGATALLVVCFSALVLMFQDLHMNSTVAVTESINNIKVMGQGFEAAGNQIGKEASKSTWCSMAAVGFNISPCGGFRMISPVISLAMQVVATALAELQGLLTLMNFVNAWLFPILFPLGLFLRAFKYTRGAGGLLMALGISAYLVLPLVYVTIHEYVVGCAAAVSGAPYNSAQVPRVAASCDAYDTDGLANEDNAISVLFGPGHDGKAGIYEGLNRLIYYALIDATLTTIVSLAVTIISIRYILHLTGAEVDVSALSRLI
ncbi:hypothetical protein KJ780_01700 [Candidatus Micrarchaeota archaeon]|nr:hypothetical protein [Candidatus Micrarchaeota archaeon]